MIKEILSGAGSILLFAAILASIALLIRRFTNVQDELFRKILHIILIIMTMFWPYMFKHWYEAAITSLLFIALLYPVFAIIGQFIDFTKFMNERKKGEFKSSIILVFIMYAVVVTLCWGWRGERLLVIAAVSAWGYGDAAAALVGKRFGRRFLQGKHIEGRKSVEGSHAMFFTSFVSVLTVLLIRGGMAWYGYLLTALITAFITSVVELYSLKGSDTITCPFAAMTCILPLVWLFGGGV